MPNLDGQLTRKRAAVTQSFCAKIFGFDVIFPNMPLLRAGKYSVAVTLLNHTAVSPAKTAGLL